MKILNLSAFLYGLSSSTTSSAFTNSQRRCSYRMVSVAARATSYRNFLRTPSSSFRRNYDVRQFSYFALNHSRSYTTDVTDSRVTSDPDSLPNTPFFRLFYNDVYEVNLPPKHRFPMGKYRKVRERVQEKVAKSRLKGVESGKLQRYWYRNLPSCHSLSLISFYRFGLL